MVSNDNPPSPHGWFETQTIQKLKSPPSCADFEHSKPATETQTDMKGQLLVQHG